MCNVMLVDDESTGLEALKKIINKLDIKINIVGALQNGKKAIEIDKEVKPDIIIIDNEMPGLNGIEASKIIKENNKDKIIILLIEYYNFNNKVVDINIDDYILKPINLENLFKILNKHIINLATNKNKLKEKELMILSKIIFNEGKDIKDLLQDLLYGYELLSNGDINIYKDKCTSLLSKMINIFIKMRDKNKAYTNLNVYNDKLYTLNNISKINIVMNEFLEFMSQDNSDDIIREKLIGSKEINTVLNPVLTYISENYNERITLESVSKACNLSIFYLSKLFKKNTGMNFIDYINLYKIEKAKQLLENTDMSIINISISLGYDESGYFSKIFKKTVGVTPSVYRNSN
ncbi:helix-turn-helix domain-containing protein [Clostridium butyricum]|uniref:response regulator transcription factor n=1 Tax=Clostridium butyricum TaxID=1492 RepID=UPI000F5491CF|nr:helix-turn-helix domain-containing protein [Clostridium butyricum]RQN09167.1 helix-turn-helix domain-containing protein [Clostridium butyricum]